MSQNVFEKLLSGLIAALDSSKNPHLLCIRSGFPPHPPYTQAARDAFQTRSQQTWFLYILECRDGTFYTGITNHLERRCLEHNKGKASRYTRSRLPVKLLYHETHKSRSAALVREYAVKGLSRESKKELIFLNAVHQKAFPDQELTLTLNP